MKNLILILIYIILAVFFYCLFSGIIYLFTDYSWKTITTEGAWQMIYVFFHWIPCGMIVDDISNHKYFLS